MKQKVFIEDLHMETQTEFQMNGDINIYPCGFELGHHIVSGADCASQKGRMVTNDDGTSHFRAYAKDSGRRYRTIFHTAHGEVKETKRSVIFQLRFPKKLGKAIIRELHRDETEQQGAFFKTRRTKNNGKK
ncbi:MAG: hypothetical protein E7070_05320 [Bacteroidales bacterium]|jgi:hypothetical protein|nr:hypothetical protein [Bacteroidales bacterium]MBE6331706.1 hypothetical protein [Bacteroidales bacterium]